MQGKPAATSSVSCRQGGTKGGLLIFAMCGNMCMLVAVRPGNADAMDVDDFKILPVSVGTAAMGQQPRKRATDAATQVQQALRVRLMLYAAHWRLVLRLLRDQCQPAGPERALNTFGRRSRAQMSGTSSTPGNALRRTCMQHAQ